jgi:uncharacterized protein (DUF1697 family)
MATYVALLYSIGIGAGGRLVMSDWRAVLATLGLENPRTFGATGNAVFESDGATVRQLEQSLEAAHRQSFGRHVDTIVRTAADWRRLAAGNPFLEAAERDGARVVVRVMRKALDQGVAAALASYATQGERLALVNGDLWIQFAAEPNRSRPLPALTPKRVGVGTVRNWNTVRRVTAVLASP